MNRTISSAILVAYAQCPLKAFQLMCTNRLGTPHEYEQILDQQRQANQRKYLEILQQKNSNVEPYCIDNLGSSGDFLINATLKADSLQAECAVLTKVGKLSFEPTIFLGTHNVTQADKLKLLFVGHVLAHIQGIPPVEGRIISVAGKSHKIALENGQKSLLPLLEPLQEWATAVSVEPPPVILNKHCPQCQFRALCQAQAKQEDNLSLLNRVTPKVIRQYEKKGIFTVKQLSHLFRPRKRSKRAKNPPPATHKIELQALAIRTGKIYLSELPALVRQPTELYLDIEGTPDLQSYYLIGLLICQGEVGTHLSFWADTVDDEADMWKQFLAAAIQYPDAPIYHYGSYEPRAIAKLTQRYSTNCGSLTTRLVNVNQAIFGKVYFPVYSNRLKDIGNYIGARWTSPDASGLQSLVWRHHWEETGHAQYKEWLLTYNAEDCSALKLLIEELSKIKLSADTLSEVDFADKRKNNTVDKNQAAIAP